MTLDFPFILPSRERRKSRGDNIHNKRHQLIVCVFVACKTYVVRYKCEQCSVFSHTSNIARGVEIETNEMSELNIEDGKSSSSSLLEWWNGMKWNEKKWKSEKNKNKCVLLCCCAISAKFDSLIRVSTHVTMWDQLIFIRISSLSLESSRQISLLSDRRPLRVHSSFRDIPISQFRS